VPFAEVMRRVEEVVEGEGGGREAAGRICTPEELTED
jgi:hypothetical protein